MKNQTPQIFLISDIIKEVGHTLVLSFDPHQRKWIVPRPLSIPSLRTRFKLAWKVLNGEYDVLKWD